ncbi:hypothetical protein C9439_07025, partial [archaeon SCG-AAA382B04]
MINQLPIIQQVSPYILITSVVLLAVAAIYLTLKTFEFSGFTSTEALILVTSPILGEILPRALENLIIYQKNTLSIGINLFGFLIPVIISLKILANNRVSKLKAFLSILVITFVSYELSYINPNQGVLVSNFYFIPLAASMISILINSKNLRKVAPLAYVSGSLGVLFGADILRIGEILQYQPTNPAGLIIGGA